MKNFFKNLTNKNFANNLGRSNVANFKKMNFSTLILPEISNGKIHASVFNLAKAASELDNSNTFLKA